MRTRTVRCILIIFILGLLTASLAWTSPTEDSGLRGPVIGYVFDANRQAIRPVNGILGSSLLGAAVDLPFAVGEAAFSPRADFSIAVSASDRAAYLLRNLGGTPTIDAIEGAITGADRVFLNAAGSAAALLASDTRQLQILRGLPGALTIETPLDLSSISGTITAVAIDSSASNILIAASDDHGALYLVSTDSQAGPQRIGNFGSPSALALLNNDRDVIVADAAISELTLLRNFATTPEAVLLAGERDGVSGPVGLRIASDNRHLYIANRSSRTLDNWNLDTQSLESSIPLDTEPTRLTPFRDSSTFLLNDVGEHPLWLLEADANPELYFVPVNRDR
jgi:hypothetical protein